MIKLFLNLVATFVLVLLLAAPGVFSNNLVEFGTEGEIVIYDNSKKFSEFLKVEEIKTNNLFQFNLEFTQFENPALYSGFLVVENLGQTEKIVKIINFNPGVLLFFAKGNQTSGPSEIRLPSSEKASVNLVVPDDSQRLDSIYFILKSD